MGIPRQWDGTIRGLWFRGMGVRLRLRVSPSILLLAATAQAAGGDLASLVRTYRQGPTPAKKAAVLAYAVTHPKEAALANLALGIAAYEQKDYAGAVASLKHASVGRIGDYAAYYLGAARVAAATGADPTIVADLEPAHKSEVRSPVAGKAWVAAGKALGADGVRVLREHYAELPQPDGDVTLADAYQAAGDFPHAVEFYQRAFYQYVSGDAPARASAALLALKDSMGASYPAPLPQQQLQRADLLLAARQYAAARSEYESLLDQLVGRDRDAARVRIGAADLAAGKPGVAAPYLRGQEMPPSEADAERLYWLEECARRMNDEASMTSALEQLGKKYPKSPWRLKALTSAANKFLVTNRPDSYLPLYKAAYEDFPGDSQAGLYHWKVTFQAYMHDQKDADDLLREHLRNYPTHATTGAALYFLGRYSERKGDNASAHAYYDRLARGLPNQFYAILARDRFKDPNVAAAAASDAAVKFASELKLTQASPPPSEPSATTSARIERSRLLRSAGLNDLADGELRFGAKSDGQAQLLGMEIARSADAPFLALRAMKAFGGDYLTLPMEQAPRPFWEMLFPMPYKHEIETEAKLRGVDPFLMAGLIRQESEYNPAAVSGAQAYGLMQVRPGTAREVARAAGVVRPTARTLTVPAVNLKVGSYVLKSMLDAQGGRVEETLASYNAGPARAAQWRTWATFREPAEFIETIPFTETRDYVQAVLRNAEIYRRLYR
jgi:soluble lytic murein transglycosylase